MAHIIQPGTEVQAVVIGPAFIAAPVDSAVLIVQRALTCYSAAARITQENIAVSLTIENLNVIKMNTSRAGVISAYHKIIRKLVLD